MSSACSVTPGTANLYRQSKPLEVDMILPESFSLNQKQVIKVNLTQGGEKVDAADIQFEIWKKDSKDNPDVINARNDEEGRLQK
ncbi:FixH family protein [Bacillus capparidis]|uniref:FixH family protein n=1 Tax=Bacillus capparidis TaxID=1840411 RepID=UPI001CEF6746|nr:FixH family protein [Bacillus capparidis]MED1097410.1 FixH family protein [Bacillus capparidis]